MRLGFTTKRISHRFSGEGGRNPLFAKTRLKGKWLNNKLPLLKFWFLIICTIGLPIGALFLAHQFTNITSVKIIGLEPPLDSTVQSLTWDILNQRDFFIWPRSHTMDWKKNDLLKMIHHQLPGRLIAITQASRELTLNFSQLVPIWRIETAGEEILLDNQGKLIPASFASDLENPSVKSPDETDTQPISLFWPESFTPESSGQFSAIWWEQIFNYQVGILKNGFSINQFAVEDFTIGWIRVKLGDSSHPYDLLVDPALPFEEFNQAWKAAMKNFEMTNLWPTEYLDLRFANSLFYK